METTARFALPLLAAGQAQKEIFHNEALQLIDGCIAPCVNGPVTAIPPGSPAVGECYLVGTGATGAWSGHEHSLALYGDGGWRFVAPREGLRVWVSGDDVDAAYVGGAWEFGQARVNAVRVGAHQVVGAQQAAIAAPSGGFTTDGEARAAIGAILGALRAHGLIAT